MPTDRCITWTKDHPTFADIFAVFKDYMSEEGYTGEVDEHRGIFGGSLLRYSSRTETTPYITVEAREDQMVVNVDPDDERLNSIADAFASLCARYWDGEYNVGVQEQRLG